MAKSHRKITSSKRKYDSQKIIEIIRELYAEDFNHWNNEILGLKQPEIKITRVGRAFVKRVLAIYDEESFSPPEELKALDEKNFRLKINYGRGPLERASLDYAVSHRALESLLQRNPNKKGSSEM